MLRHARIAEFCVTFCGGISSVRKYRCSRIVYIAISLADARNHSNLPATLLAHHGH